MSVLAYLMLVVLYWHCATGYSESSSGQLTMICPAGHLGPRMVDVDDLHFLWKHQMFSRRTGILYSQMLLGEAMCASINESNVFRAFYDQTLSLGSIDCFIVPNMRYYRNDLASSIETVANGQFSRFCLDQVPVCQDLLGSKSAGAVEFNLDWWSTWVVPKRQTPWCLCADTNDFAHLQFVRQVVSIGATKEFGNYFYRM